MEFLMHLFRTFIVGCLSCIFIFPLCLLVRRIREKMTPAVIGGPPADVEYSGETIDASITNAVPSTVGNTDLLEVSFSITNKTELALPLSVFFFANDEEYPLHFLSEKVISANATAEITAKFRTEVSSGTIVISAGGETADLAVFI